MNKLLIFVSFTLIMLSSCEKDDFCNCLENEGSQISETRTFPDFERIEMNNNVDIILTPDSVSYAILTCGKNLADGIKTEVVDGWLKVRNINRCNWLRDFTNKFTLDVHYRSIKGINYLGSGNLSCSDTLRTSELLVESWNGTGTLDFVLNSGDIYFKLHTGPADIQASGLANYLYVYSAGNGYIKTASLNSEYVVVNTKSTGDCEVNANQTLEVNIGYNGDVFYHGNPPDIQQVITGKGKLYPF